MKEWTLDDELKPYRVSDLIRVLKEFPQDALVVIEGSQFNRHVFMVGEFDEAQFDPALITLGGSDQLVVLS